jgi:hypothetical protein
LASWVCWQKSLNEFWKDNINGGLKRQNPATRAGVQYCHLFITFPTLLSSRAY